MRPAEITAEYIKQVREFKAVHTHIETLDRFNLGVAYNYAINVLGRDYNLSDEQLAKSLPELDKNDIVPENIAAEVLDDKQFIQFLESRMVKA